MSDEVSAYKDGDSAKPMCKYGKKCYRKNPVHFEEFRHPGKCSMRSANKTSLNSLKKGGKAV